MESAADRVRRQLDQFVAGVDRYLDEQFDAQLAELNAGHITFDGADRFQPGGITGNVQRAASGHYTDAPGAADTSGNADSDVERDQRADEHDRPVEQQDEGERPPAG
jgi:hypothetical protein